MTRLGRHLRLCLQEQKRQEAVRGPLIELPQSPPDLRPYRLYSPSPALDARYDSLSKIADIKVPLLVFQGDREGIVPEVDGPQTLRAGQRESHQCLWPPREWWPQAPGEAVPRGLKTN
jgi:hypothetical protein